MLDITVNVNPSGAGKCQDKKVNRMDVDDLSPSVTRLLTAMLLTMLDHQAIVFLGKRL